MHGEQETFWSLLRDSAHWEFELFVNIIQDLIIGVLIWPRIKKHWKHHLDRDKKDGVIN